MHTKALRLRSISLLAALFFVTSFLAMGMALAEGEGEEYNRQVSVTGNGKVSAEPDVVFVNVGVNSWGETAVAAKEKNDKSIKEILSIFSEAGVEASDMHTTWVTTYPEYSYPMDGMGESKITGYRMDHSLEIRVENMDKISEEGDNSIMGRLVMIEGIMVNGMNYALENPEQYLTEARKGAAADAKKKAEALGRIFQFKVGKLITVSESSYSNYMPYPYYDGKGYGGMNTTPQKIDVTLDLYVSFELLDSSSKE